MKKSYLLDEAGKLSTVFVKNMKKELDNHRESIALSLVVIFGFPIVLFVGAIVILFFLGK